MIARYRDGVVPDGRGRPGAGGRVRRGCRTRSPRCSTTREVSQALEAIWQRVRRLNRYVEERAPWKLAKDPAQADELDETLATLAEGLRAVTVLLHPYMPRARPSSCWPRSAGRTSAFDEARALAGAGWGGGSRDWSRCSRSSSGAGGAR